MPIGAVGRRIREMRGFVMTRERFAERIGYPLQEKGSREYYRYIH